MTQPQIHVPSRIIYAREDGTKDIFICHEKLGHGGFAVVHRVTHQNTNKTYAMKVISKERYSSSKGKSILEKLKNEISIQKNLVHPNIVRSKLSFSDEFNQYIVLEYCPGKSIREYLRKSETGRLSESETRKILKDVVQGLIYLHNRKIIHHDIKLENFIVGVNGKVKIADFGISAVLKDDSEKNNSICGTASYMSPEILSKDTKGHGFEVDIWAVGVSAFVMLTGQQPFEGFDKEMIYERIKKCDYHFPLTVPLSLEAKDFIKSILRIDPNKRPTAIDLIGHPFLTKFDNEQIQLYKPPQLPQNKIPIIQNNNFVPLLKSIRKPSPSIRPMNNFCNVNLRRSSNMSVPKVMDDFNTPFKKMNNSLPLSIENNQLNNNFNSPLRKSFVVPRHFVTKYCFHGNDLGYLLGDGTVGVCFDDRSRIVIDPNEEFIQYYKNYNSSAEVVDLNECFDINEDLQGKISLVQKFARSFKKFVCLYDITSDFNDSFTPLHHVKYFVKKSESILFKLNDKNIQVNFNDRKKLIIFWNTKKMCIVRLLKEKCNLLDLKDVVNMNSNCEEYKKYKYAKEMLSALALKI